MTTTNELLTISELYHQINRCTAHILVFEDKEVISEGSGFAVSADGVLLTAAHVIAGGFPVRPGEVDHSARVVYVMFPQQGRQMRYRPIACPFEIRGAGLEKPVQLDFAVLVPIEKPDAPLNHLMPTVDEPTLGQELYFGGYSDEVEMPFLVDRHLSPKADGLDAFQRGLATKIKSRIGGPIIKRGAVGNVVIGQAIFDSKPLIKQTAFYLDNQIHSGASGGPIVRRDGKAIGIIAKRSVTKAGDVEVPAGSTLGLGLEPLLSLMKPAAPDARDP